MTTFTEDASPVLVALNVGLGVVLSQKQGDGKYHPVAYASRSWPQVFNLAIFTKFAR